MGSVSTGSRRGVLLVITGVSVASLALGFAAASMLTSPGEAAARTAPPEPSAITVPVERRELATRIVARGDAVFDGAMDVAVLTGGLDVPAVVTGAVPEVGDTIEAGDVALEIVGRPVLALTGGLPVYRTLTPGMAGPDVLQLKAALAALGLDPGDVDDDTYDRATAGAVAALYERAGYPAPPPSPAAADRLRAARDALRAAREGVTAAEQTLADARRPPSEATRLAMDAQVREARRAHDAALASDDPDAIEAAESALAIAIAQRDELLAAPDTRVQAAALEAARGQRRDAERELADAEAAAGTPLPASEVVFLATLPRRVDRVAVTRGGLVDGAVLSVSGADLVVVATISASDRRLVEEGATALLDVDGDTVEATIAHLDASTDGPADAVLVPVELSPEQAAALRGRNVRVTIPISATDGEVLVVPLAALTAGPGGQSRVEVQRPDGTTELVEVEVGLAADGYAEVDATAGALAEGDLVVVGR